jgi:phospholipid/cholesterol/gamma-HCH transport system substrate-binding protein
VRRFLAILAVAGVCAAAFLLAGASNEEGGGTYRIEFDNAFGLVPGGDFRVGGVNAGRTKSFDVVKRKGETAKAVVEVEITEPGFADFRRDASCDIRPQSLIGEYYVDCHPGKAEQKLPAGGTIPVEQTRSTIPADLVNNIMRRPARERLRLLVTELGTGLAGRPDDLQEVLRRAHPGLRETSRTLRILGEHNAVIESFIANADAVISELERNKGDVVRWIREAGDAAKITATRRNELRAGLRRLPTFLDELKPTMARLGDLADEQTPLLADLQRAAPSLDTFLTRVGPFADAGRPAVDSLGEATKVGNRVVRKGRQEIAELRELAREAQPFAKPLRQFLETTDDRRRAIEVDPRAQATAPPAPDPTAISGSGGFTGMEAIWNYFFWQTLSTNMVDDVGHVLRASLTATPDCAGFRNTPPRTPKDHEIFERCNSYLGPNQPGIFSPDPLDGSSAQAARVRAESNRPAQAPGERRAEGEPEAGPLPGQRDLSQPQVVLPPQLQELLESLTPRERRRLPLDPRELEHLDPRRLQQELGEALGVPAPALPAPGPAPAPVPAPPPLPLDQQSTGQLLDYLLAP